MVKEAIATGVTASQEDYLEAIHWLSEEDGGARSRDIAERLGVTRSTVSGALKQMQADGLVAYDPYREVSLTDTGAAVAENVIRRHLVLRDFLYQVLGLSAAAADRFACAMEHSIDDDVRQRFEAFMAMAAADAPDLADWLEKKKEERDAAI